MSVEGIHAQLLNNSGVKSSGLYFQTGYFVN